MKKREVKAFKARLAARDWRESTKDWKMRVRRDAQLRDGNCCFYCNYPFTPDDPPTIEHLLSVAAGGSDHLDNLVLACGACNKKVGNSSLIKKIKYREFRLITKI